MADGQAFYGSPGLINQFVYAFLRGVGPFFIFNVNCSRPDQGIAMDSRGYQHAFPKFAGKLENRMCHKPFGRTIQQAVIPAPWGNVQLLPTHHVMELVCIDACSIYHIFCFNVPLAGFYNPASVFFLQPGYFCIKFKFHAVGCCIFCKCNVHAEGANNPARRRIQCCHCFV